ncbi:hypothetical protein EMVG_00162 [Emiliania huxleyi virus PS401]|nr:hypothetical protein EMVG_00162 [Emiliania huxleyi virus PS401]
MEPTQPTQTTQPILTTSATPATPRELYTDARQNMVKAAMHGVDADPSSIDVLINSLLAAHPLAMPPSESHVLWLRRELLKLIAREADLAVREKALDDRLQHFQNSRNYKGSGSRHRGGRGRSDPSQMV